ncbi:Heparinase II/III-like protein [Micromonospora rhizosphaerae]|uniref:Heparinase II/III-like protein n=1 Tax=Micromonospora rhizosphaerae TaxID=568872 RepID=A0A1C6SBC0_9ACTN|nr:heparinase II/III family protein [Micromonospora rhizosphaerae]SCL26631.1 Heparinase II/III-like protein [Micromonospora rhizosphaerae]
MTTLVEKARHVDELRMRHISPEALAAAVDVPDLRARLSTRTGVTPVRDPLRWAAHLRGTPRAAEVLAAADALLDQPFDFTDPAHGRSGLYGFHYLYWTNPLVQAYALTGERRYAERFGAIVDDWYAVRDQVRGEWPGLDVVWYTLGVACRSQVLLGALHTLGHELSEKTRHRLVATLLGGARWLAEEHDAFRHGNWQLAGCAVLTEIAGYLPEFTEASAWSAVAGERLHEHLMLDVYADGGHYERSPSYHLMCLAGLQNAALRDESLRAHPRLRAMHDWLLAMATPGGVVPPFNDSHVPHVAEPLLRGWHLYGDPAYLAVARAHLPAERIAEILAWLELRELPAESPEAAPARSVLLPQSKFAVLRVGGHYGVVNCGPYIEHELESHSHHAALDLVLWGHGAALAWEPGGPESYDDPQYQGWYRATRAHNTIQPGDGDVGEDHDARVDAHVRLPECDMLVAEHTGWGAPHRRCVLLLRDDPTYWVISDDYQDGPYDWRLGALQPWSGDPATGLHGGIGPALLVLPVDLPQAVRTDSGPTRIPDAEGASSPATLYGLTLRYPAGRARHVLVPYAATRPTVSLSEAGPVLRIAHAGGVDVIGDGSVVRLGDGRLRAAASWAGNPIEHAGRTLVRGRADAVGLTVDADRWTVTAEVAARTVLWIAAAGATRLDGVRISPTRVDGGSRVTLPAAGRWRVQIDSEGER